MQERSDYELLEFLRDDGMGDRFEVMLNSGSVSAKTMGAWAVFFHMCGCDMDRAVDLVNKRHEEGE